MMLHPLSSLANELRPTPLAVKAQKEAVQETEKAKSQLYSELTALLAECDGHNWDGYGARPIASSTYWLARSLAHRLPDGLPIPLVGAEPDGSITFEWYRDPSHILSLSVAGDGRLYFAANIGSRKRSGSDQSAEGLPAEVIDLIHAILSK